MLLWLAIMCLSTSLSSIHRVFISNLQKEIEKQTGHRSSRKRRSESQYDYEVYHSLEEVDVKPTIYPPISHSPLPSNLMHTQSKQTSSPRSSQTRNYPIPQLSPSDCFMLSHTETCTPPQTLHGFRVFIFPPRWAYWFMNLSGPMKQHGFHRYILRTATNLSFNPLLSCKHTLTYACIYVWRWRHEHSPTQTHKLIHTHGSIMHQIIKSGLMLKTLQTNLWMSFTLLHYFLPLRSRAGCLRWTEPTPTWLTCSPSGSRTREDRFMCFR